MSVPIAQASCVAFDPDQALSGSAALETGLRHESQRQSVSHDWLELGGSRFRGMYCGGQSRIPISILIGRLWRRPRQSFLAAHLQDQIIGIEPSSSRCRQSQTFIEQ